MLNAEQNRMLTECHAGTAMGELYRRHWVPVAVSRDLPLRAGPPKRITILGEQLVIFRDGAGQVGLLSEWCPHRGASLYFGRNERADSPTGPGLTCVYHGWKFSTTGACLDMPNEPSESTFKDRVRARAAYPCVELAGVVFAYLGPPEFQPPAPRLPWTQLPDDHVYASVRLHRANSVQVMEGAVDASHVGILHSDIGIWDQGGEFKRVTTAAPADTAPRFFVAHADHGITIGARRRLVDGRAYWRFTQVALPWYVTLSAEPDAPISGHAWVPVDEHRCFMWTFNFRPDRPLDPQELAGWQSGLGLHARLIPGSLTPVDNRDNDYNINRALQSSGLSMTGISGIAMQDAAVQENMGPTIDSHNDEIGSRIDRTTEKLGSADAGVIATRRLLLAAATALEKDPQLRPPGVLPEDQRRSCALPSFLLDDAVGWDQALARAEGAAGIS